MILPRIGHYASDMKAKTKILVSLAVSLLLGGGIIGRRALLDHPKVRAPAPIDDLSVPAAEILALSPDVARIDVLVAAARPTHRIVQIVDSHYFPLEGFPSGSRKLSEEEICDYVSDVKDLQETQLRLLCWLVDNHGLSEVFQEGRSEQTLSLVERELNGLRDWCAWREKAGADAARLRSEVDCADAQRIDAATLRRRLSEVEQYAQWGLYHGAVMRLLLARPSVRLRPAEDKDALETHRRRGFPAVGSSMYVREAAVVENMLRRSKCAIIVLGGAHDLSDQVKRLGGGRCEYIRVVPRGFAQCLAIDGPEDWPHIRWMWDRDRD